MTRIALIHALAHSVAPINDALAKEWPQAQRINLLDDSLSADLAVAGGKLDEAMTSRFVTLTDYAVQAGAQGILFTCSAFGPCIEVAARRHPTIPVLKPNEAMIADAVAAVAAAGGGAIGLVASFGPTLQQMPAEFPPGIEVKTALAHGALESLNRGDKAHHDKLAADAAQHLAEQGCKVIALAQFSLARAAPTVAAITGLPVLTTVGSALRNLRARLGTT
jgi:aspartate/glutamate racemase